MNQEEVLSRLTPILREVFEDPSLVATPLLTAETVERWDSLTHMDLMLLVEEAFAIRIPTRDVGRMKNVGDLVRIIQALAS